MTTSGGRRAYLAAAALVAAAALALAGCTAGSGQTDASGSAARAAATATPSTPAAAATATPSTPAATSAATPTPTSAASAASQPETAPLTGPEQNQVAYALEYWKNYNSAVYGNDNPNGGDCANFVSQTLIQRGWKMNSAWYDHGQGQMSPDWAYVPAMENYFSADATSLGLEQLGPNDRAKYAVGDVVVFWWRNANGGYSAGPDHVQVIDKIIDTGGRIQVEMASHNLDYEYRDLDDEITNEHPGAKFVVWHLTRDTN